VEPLEVVSKLDPVPVIVWLQRSQEVVFGGSQLKGPDEVQHTLGRSKGDGQCRNVIEFSNPTVRHDHDQTVGFDEKLPGGRSNEAVGEISRIAVVLEELDKATSLIKVSSFNNDER